MFSVPEVDHYRYHYSKLYKHHNIMNLAPVINLRHFFFWMTYS